MRYKDSFVLLELIFSIILSGVLFGYLLNNILELKFTNKVSYSRLFAILELESTKLFLEKHNSFKDIKYLDGILYYKTNILLKDISFFNKISLDNYTKIKICLKNNICQEWYIK